MESDSSSSESTSQQGRKRLRCVEQWKRKKRKIKKDSGKSFKTYRGERKSCKQPPVSLSCRCQYHCSSRVSMAERKRIFGNFYELADHDSQNKYLFGLIERSSPKQRRPRGATNAPRGNVFYYFVRLREGDRINVCKQAFCQIHAIGKRRVEVLCKKVVSGVLFSGDNRGKHKNRPHAICNELKTQIREHITSFPCRESHYSRHDNRQRKYLPDGLSIARMYRLYLEKYEPDLEEREGQPQVKEWLYRKIFNEEFNIGFGYPRSDTCERCDLLKVAIESAQTEEERSGLQTELASHHEKAAQGYQSLRSDSEKCKADASSVLFTFDLQQNLPVPTLTHGPMFYMRQLWVYNFGIHDCCSNSAVMCVWNETIAGRGSNEIISCLLEYITQIPPQIKTLTCYSDSCFGQNKNSQIICFWSNLILQKRFTRIDHKYLVRGHTYLPNDRDFAQIEKRKASAKVYLPEQWEEIIRESCPSKPFRIQRMTKEKFFDFMPLTQCFTLRKKDNNGLSVLISKANWLNFGEGEDSGTIVSHPGEYWMKSSFDSEEPWQKVCILKGRRKLTPPSDIDCPIKYPHGHPINPKKVADLQTMIPYLPSSYRDFFRCLSHHPVSADTRDDHVMD